MKLKNLLTDVAVLETIGNLDVEVNGVRGDSRRIRKGDVFVAVRGEQLDGHHFIEDAIHAGASAVICERMIHSFPSITRVRVGNGPVALAGLSSNFHGTPSKNLKVIGITGTNGKTTTSYLLASILEAAGLSTGIIGTIAYRMGNRELPAPNTTPPADDLQELMAQMLCAGMKAIVMEVSSHSLAQHRVDGIMWDLAIFTNLTQDHLDYHKSMEAYFEAKKLLFQQLKDSPKKTSAILNLDDSRSEQLQKTVGKDVSIKTYSLHLSSADVRAESVEYSVSGCRFTLVYGESRIEIATPLCGAHNLSNCLAAAAAGLALGLDDAAIKKGIESIKNVPGRLERLDIPSEVGSFAVFIDYAHTDDALRHVLKTLRPVTQRHLIAVFGCGGNRDATKRPMMGRVACELSDFSILTSDNPRYEDPSVIVRQIADGFESSDHYKIILDRREAIREALIMAKDGDVVLLAGKGHETYQEVCGTRSAFNDREVTRELLKNLSVEMISKEATWKN